MLMFGHPGITLGAAVLLNGMFGAGPSRPMAEAKVPAPLPMNCARRVESWLTSLAQRIDLRLLLIGSLLPDIIDKPTGMLFFRDTFNNGRIFAHTLLFLILVTLGGLYRYFRGKRTGLLVLGFGTFMHLILDEAWLNPRMLLWPLFGLSFDAIDLTGWAPNIFHALFTDPATYIPELVGLAILTWFAWVLARRRGVCAFITSGHQP